MRCLSSRKISRWFRKKLGAKRAPVLHIPFMPALGPRRVKHPALKLFEQVYFGENHEGHGGD